MAAVNIHVDSEPLFLKHGGPVIFRPSCAFLFVNGRRLRIQTVQAVSAVHPPVPLPRFRAEPPRSTQNVTFYFSDSQLFACRHLLRCLLRLSPQHKDELAPTNPGMKD